MQSMYNHIPAQVDLVASERQVLRFWAKERVFERSLKATEGGIRWTAFEGPPTANGTPGAHHIEARTFKDILPRFRTMQGYYVKRRAGWDCHGLPVELAVEKDLGFNGKPDIEAYGMAEFNSRCRESVMRYVAEWQELTTRMGYWMDMDHPYKTMDKEYIESVWWSLKQIFDKGLLEEDFRVAPYCPRCGTTLSDHELAQGYEEDTDPSVFVRFPLISGPLAGRAALLVWTTTPWTLPSNTAVAVRGDLTYVVVTNGTERLVLAEDTVATVLDNGWAVEESFAGSDLAGWTYSRPFTIVDFSACTAAHCVVQADFVTASDGTGLVHLAPAFGADDLRAARQHDLPVVNPLEGDGHFAAGVPLVGGLFFKAADSVLVSELRATGKLFKEVDYVHQYPHCWRCHTHLIYYALPAWYIRTTKIKDQLLEENEKTSWHPETIKHGRYGNWLENNVDWALSRSRYWGTPLPIWRNDTTGSLIVVGSMAELSGHSGRDLSGVDPHRPYIDEITFSMASEEGTYRRVPDVIDAWYDSGAMPFAQWGYPHVPGSRQLVEEAYPAQFVCEAIDQTRGWFYSLMAVGTLVFDRSSYETVVCLGHILAEDGRKMSKHLGNILLPVPLMDEHTADAVRWFMACSGSPWSARLVGPRAIDEIVRRVLLTYWNAAAFQALYARAAGWSPNSLAPKVAERSVLDRWILGEAHRLVRAVTGDLETYNTQSAGGRIANFLDLLSNWYIRRSRRRFWAGEPSALATLHEVLRLVTLVMAPTTPFVTERVWIDLFATTSDTQTPSVHLASWPMADDALIDDELNELVLLSRHIVELGRSARTESNIKTRQPLRRATISTLAYDRLTDDLLQEIAAELNVQSVESFATAGEVVSITAKGNFRALGKRFGRQTQNVANAIANADASGLAASLALTGRATVVVDGVEVGVFADDLIVSERPRDGWAIAQDQGETVALDLEIDAALREAGLAREIIRVVQEARKRSGLEVTDRIHLRWHGSDAVLAVLGSRGPEIAGDVLAVSTTFDPSASSWTDSQLGLSFELRKV